MDSSYLINKAGDSVKQILKVIRWFIEDTISPIHLTLSKINDIKTCGLKYKFKQHYNLEEIVAKEYPQGLIGQIFHQWIYRILSKEVRIDKTLENDLPDLIMAEVYQKFTDLSEEDKSFHTTNVKRMCETFFKWYEKNGDKVKYVNYDITIKFHRMKLSSKCDCILEEENGDYVIIDFVTGKKNLSSEMLTFDFDTNYMYFVLNSFFKKHLPDKKFKLKKVFLQHNNIAEFTMNEFQQKDLQKVLLETKTILRDKEFKLHKGPLCGWCGYYDICPGWKFVREGDETTRIPPIATDTTLFRIARETPNRMGLSYSKMSMFIQCPRRYRLCYLDRAGVKPHSVFSIGTTIHNTLEEFYKIKPKFGKEPTLEELYKIYNEKWLSAGYRDYREEKEYFENGKNWLTNYYEKFVKGRYIPAFALEKYFELPIAGKHVMIGYIDRIQKNPDGTYEIFDYKTDPKIRTQQEVDEDLQLTIYYWAMKFEGINIVRLSLIFLRFNEMVSTVRTEENIAKLDVYVKEVAEKMVEKGTEYQKFKSDYGIVGVVPKEYENYVEDIFPAKVNKYCNSCDYFSGCPREEEIKTRYKDKLLIDTIESEDREIQQEIITEESVEIPEKKVVPRNETK